jgi:hypothetical protein
MPSQNQISRFARRWLAWYPAIDEAALRQVLHRRFLGRDSDIAVAGGAVLGGAEATQFIDGPGSGCLAATIVVLLAPLTFCWRWLFPVDREQTAVAIFRVLATLRAEGRWGG